MLTGREVTVIGGGIGGLAAAVAIAQRGAVVTVIEQAPVISEVGAGLQISPNGWRVLEALGIGTTLAETSPRARAVRLRDFRRGAEVFSVPLTHPDQPYYLVHRSDLIATLAGAARDLGVTFRLGTRVRAVELAGMQTRLTFDDGTVETHGLTLAADGLHSAGRQVLNPRSRPFFSGQVAWRCVIETDTPQAPEAQVIMGPGRHVVRYPLRGGRLINVVAVEERDAWAKEGWFYRDDPAHLSRAFVDFCPEVRALLAQAQDVFLWGLFRHPVADNWHDGALALLGDAAHPTLPFLAQGANMALEDAWVLARVLHEEHDLSTALAQYQAARRPRTNRIVQAASDNATNYHLRPGPARFAAHTALRLAARMAPQVVTGRLDWLYRHDVTR